MNATCPQCDVRLVRQDRRDGSVVHWRFQCPSCGQFFRLVQDDERPGDAPGSDARTDQERWPPSRPSIPPGVNYDKTQEASGRPWRAYGHPSPLPGEHEPYSPGIRSWERNGRHKQVRIGSFATLDEAIEARKCWEARPDVCPHACDKHRGSRRRGRDPRQRALSVPPDFEPPREVEL